MVFTKQSRIVNIGHLPSHTNGKTELLNANGFTDVVTVLCEEKTAAEIKTVLSEAPPDSLFLVGGAMMGSFPDLMKDLLEHIAAECPNVSTHCTVKGDFDPDVTFPPSTEQVCKSGLNICLKRLAAAEAEVGGEEGKEA